MTTRMAHPEHGFTHAYSADEIEKLRKSGWRPETEVKAELDAAAAHLSAMTLSEPKAPAEPPLVLPVVEAPRRGRPPKAK